MLTSRHASRAKRPIDLQNFEAHFLSTQNTISVTATCVSCVFEDATSSQNLALKRFSATAPSPKNENATRVTSVNLFKWAQRWPASLLVLTTGSFIAKSEKNHFEDRHLKAQGAIVFREGGFGCTHRPVTLFGAVRALLIADFCEVFRRCVPELVILTECLKTWFV